MKPYLIKFLKRAITVTITASFLTASFGFKILDPKNYNVFFRGIYYSLEEYGIDVVQDWTSKVELEGRPTLAPIANYKVSVLDKQNAWTKAYSTLYANALVAMDTKQSVTASTFMDRWKATPAEKRVFISFTKEDLVHAENIKKVLEEKGYKVFLYTESHRAPFTSPDMIVYCMKTAGEVLVLDTENSRGKIGVIAETFAFAKYTYKPEKELIAENELLKSQVRDAIDKMQVKGINSDEIFNNIAKFYEENDKKTYSKDDIIKKVKETYPSGVDEFSTSEFLERGRQNYLNYLLNDESLTPYAYNKKLTTNISYLKERPLIDLSKLESFLNIASYFAICPYYKIPIRLCPICSRGLR